MRRIFFLVLALIWLMFGIRQLHALLFGPHSWRVGQEVGLDIERLTLENQEVIQHNAWLQSRVAALQGTEIDRDLLEEVIRRQLAWYYPGEAMITLPALELPATGNGNNLSLEDGSDRENCIPTASPCLP